MYLRNQNQNHAVLTLHHIFGQFLAKPNQNYDLVAHIPEKYQKNSQYKNHTNHLFTGLFSKNDSKVKRDSTKISYSPLRISNKNNSNVMHGQKHKRNAKIPQYNSEIKTILKQQQNKIGRVFKQFKQKEHRPSSNKQINAKLGDRNDKNVQESYKQNNFALFQSHQYKETQQNRRETNNQAFIQPQTNLKFSKNQQKMPIFSRYDKGRPQYQQNAQQPGPNSLQFYDNIHNPYSEQQFYGSLNKKGRRITQVQEQLDNVQNQQNQQDIISPIVGNDPCIDMDINLQQIVEQFHVTLCQNPKADIVKIMKHVQCIKQIKPKIESIKLEKHSEIMKLDKQITGNYVVTVTKHQKIREQQTTEHKNLQQCKIAQSFVFKDYQKYADPRAGEQIFSFDLSIDHIAL